MLPLFEVINFSSKRSRGIRFILREWRTLANKKEEGKTRTEVIVKEREKYIERKRERKRKGLSERKQERERKKRIERERKG